MTIISPRGKVFRDPVHGLIRIESNDSYILDLINTPEFQRLRRIKQLGVSSYTYPGAEHTRFAHSLGVFNFAQRILAVLKMRYSSEKGIVEILEQQDRVVKAAALLHDVGHGPFSHLIERAFKASADHEDKTTELIQNGTIADCLRRNSIDPIAVAEIISKTSKYRFLVDIVSSQLDADRMDYILRDAINTGVKYGAYDAEWILNSLCLGREPSPTNGDELSQVRLCLDEQRGLYSAEQLVMARMHMSYQVYFHRVTRGWEAHLLCLLRLASEMAQSGELPTNTPSSLVQFLEAKNPLTGDDWLWFDESAIEAALHVWAANNATQKLADLSRTFLLRQKSFQCAELGTIDTLASFRILNGAVAVGKDGIDWLLDDLNKFKSYKDYDSAFRGERKKSDSASDSTTAILIADGELATHARPAESVSDVLEGLGSHPQGSRASSIRLYFHRQIEDPIKKMLEEMKIKVR